MHEPAVHAGRPAGPKPEPPVPRRRLLGPSGRTRRQDGAGWSAIQEERGVGWGCGMESAGLIALAGAELSITW